MFHVSEAISHDLVDWYARVERSDGAALHFHMVDRMRVTAGHIADKVIVAMAADTKAKEGAGE
jgi:hypothetical protein